MEATVFNPTQLHLLKMFSYAKTEDALLEVKKVEDDMDALWEQGLWSQEKNEAVLKEHLRTPYED